MGGVPTTVKPTVLLRLEVGDLLELSTNLTRSSASRLWISLSAWDQSIALHLAN